MAICESHAISLIALFSLLIASRNVEFEGRENRSKQELFCANEMLRLPSSEMFGENFEPLRV